MTANAPTISVVMLGTSEGPVGKVAINSALNLSALEHFAGPEKDCKGCYPALPFLPKNQQGRPALIELSPEGRDEIRERLRKCPTLG
jgi:hypothetical protein